MLAQYHKSIGALTLAMALALTGCARPEPTGPSPALQTEEKASPVPAASVAAEETAAVTGVDTALLVTERYHLQCDSPEYCRLDLALPLFQEDLPGGAEINNRIQEDWALFLDASPEELQDIEYGFTYPMVRIYYEQYLFENLFELVIRYQAYSLYGSGPASFNTVYCYDLKSKEVSSLLQLMEYLGVSETDVIDQYMDEYGIGEAEREWIAFEKDLVGQFFFDAERAIQFEANQ